MRKETRTKECEVFITDDGKIYDNEDSAKYHELILNSPNLVKKIKHYKTGNLDGQDDDWYYVRSLDDFDILAAYNNIGSSHYWTSMYKEYKPLFPDWFLIGVDSSGDYDSIEVMPLKYLLEETEKQHKYLNEVLNALNE